VPHKLVYFDTNIYAIIKNHLRDQTADYDLIKRAIKLDFIMIPGSLAVLEEALPLYRSKSPTLFALEKQTYAEIMNWKVFIKHHAKLLRDEIEAYVNNTQFSPFTVARLVRRSAASRAWAPSPDYEAAGPKLTE
jgi:hypothetical protein